MNIKKASLRKEQIKMAMLMQWIKKGYLWAKSLLQERSASDYSCDGRTPRFIDKMIDMCSHQLNSIIWQNYQHPTQFR